MTRLSKQELIARADTVKNNIVKEINEFLEKNPNLEEQYERFTIPKKNGGLRHICAPKPELKRLQHKILFNILYWFKTSTFTHGFKYRKGTKTNATAHRDSIVAVNIDLQNFFQNITKDMVINALEREGAAKDLVLTSEDIESIATICTLKQKTIRPVWTCPKKEGEDGLEVNENRVVFAGNEEIEVVSLSQGAPTSPALSNIVCFEMDLILSQAIRDDVFYRYSRYADDLTFSISRNAYRHLSINEKQKVKHLLTSIPFLCKIAVEKGFYPNPSKIHVMKKGRRITVTGITVNENPNYPRSKYRILRSKIHNMFRDLLFSNVKPSYSQMAEVKGLISYARNFMCYGKIENIKTKFNRIAQVIDFPVIN